jgi:type II secretion system protein C
MWRRMEMKFNGRLADKFAWRRYAPRVATAALAGLMALDVAHTVWALRAASGVPQLSQPAAAPTPEPQVDAHQIVDAHLFGQSAAAVVAVDPEHAPDTDLPLTLSGTIATADPSGGFAILGAADKPSHMYRTGAALDDVSGGRLQQVFIDRVVLDLNGQPQTLRLPRKGLFVGERSSTGETSVAQSDLPPSRVADPDVITPAEGWFAQLNIEQTHSAETNGLVMHPAKRFQREYGLKDSDILTAVDGVEITDSQTLADTLRTNAKSLSLTFVRDGVPRTVNLPMTN